jgi:hypothetical protein
MRRFCTIMFACGVTMAILGFWMEVIHAADTVVPNAKCITMLAPGTCALVGSSACTAKVAGGAACGGSCAYCNSTVALPSKVCVYWEGANCTTDNGALSQPCGNVPRMTGTCQTSGGVCVCLNTAQNGNCTATAAYPICK